MKKYARLGALLTLSTLLTATLAFMGGAPLRSLRIKAGPVFFWAANFVVTGILFLLGAPVLAFGHLAIFATVGLFTELDEMEFSTFSSGLGALGLVAIVGTASFAFWVASRPGTWMSQLVLTTQPIYDQVLALKPDLEISHESLLFQLPGAFVLMLMVAIYVSLISEGFFNKWTQVESVRSLKLAEFKTPVEMIWVLLASILAAFYKHDYEVVTYLGSNFLVMSIGVYFFQGLAVTSHFFKRIKLGLVWQVLAYFILASQLVVLVAMIGVADMWLEFRENKKDDRTKEKIKSENY